MKPIRKMRLFAAALTVACLLAATVRTVAAGRGKAVLTGVVYGDGAPLAGVCVSDGVQFATTDAAGRYRIESDKSAGFVFAVTPSNWVAAEADGVQPLFWAALDEVDARDEQHDFHFASVDQSRYTVMFFTDLHLTNSSEKRDLDHYRSIALASISDEAAQASARGPVYSLNLGDLSHDLYWYQYDFDVSSAKRFLEQNGFPTLLYSIPGNHDNDPYVADDFESENPWRENLGPTYYSFDIGDIHYIQLDNTLFTNTGGAQGTVGKLDYTEGLTADQLRWLEADLQRVPAGKTVFVGMHIQFTNRYRIADGKLSWSYAMPADCRAKMLDLLAPYTVHFVTGHTHINYANRITERMTEHNIAAVCATWWWTGNYTNGRTQMCRDGAPAGYGLFEIGTAGADDVQWHYQAIGKAADDQFRAYDLNRCLIPRDKYCPDIKNNFGTVSAEFFAQYANGYDRPRSDNTVLINVFNWNEKWKVEVREVETGNRLPVEQVDTYDPLHTIHFNMNRMNTNSTAMTFPTLLTSHMFEAVCSSPTTTLEITATDEFGRSYTEMMSRPRELYDMSVSPQW